MASVSSAPAETPNTAARLAGSLTAKRVAAHRRCEHAAEDLPDRKFRFVVGAAAPEDGYQGIPFLTTCFRG
ncbi:hypothetical protein Raf01_77770 [Rugosimonospora africana]|uniref:Uncharacterized protein n=1 Tax=Rugosimonospora africana TaxID=556532 RepID=A0A8J3QY85_9ACTN|nr:hypothetical protein Raf01_77770 [Rugosimonospora africana]